MVWCGAPPGNRLNERMYYAQVAHSPKSPIQLSTSILVDYWVHAACYVDILGRWGGGPRGGKQNEQTIIMLLD